MDSAAAIIKAGGAGVFIDNCGNAFGGSDWVAMTEDGGSDAISFAFVSVVRGKAETYSVGMHVLGLSDIIMRTTDVGPDGEEVVDVIRYMSRSEKIIANGHIVADERGPRFQVSTSLDKFGRMDEGTAMHNPYGHLKLSSVKNIAENN